MTTTEQEHDNKIESNLANSAEKKTYNNKLSIEILEEMGACIGCKQQYVHESMLDYIQYYNNVEDSIINSAKLLEQIQLAMDLVVQTVKNDGLLWFVGSNNQYVSTIIKQKCIASDIPHVSHKWIAGCLSNWAVTRENIKKLIKQNICMSNQEGMKIPASVRKIAKNFANLTSQKARSITGNKPELLIVFDSNQHSYALKEAMSTDTKVIVITDTDSDVSNLVHKYHNNTIIIPFNLANVACVNFIIDLFVNAINKIKSNNNTSAKSAAYKPRY